MVIIYFKIDLTAQYEIDIGLQEIDLNDPKPKQGIILVFYSFIIIH